MLSPGTGLIIVQGMNASDDELLCPRCGGDPQVDLHGERREHGCECGPDAVFPLHHEGSWLYLSVLLGGALYRRTPDGWRPMSARSLLVFDRTSPVWVWLRSQGIRRPSPSGPRDREREAPRPAPVRLTPRAELALAGLLVPGETRAQALERLLCGGN